MRRVVLPLLGAAVAAAVFAWPSAAFAEVKQIVAWSDGDWRYQVVEDGDTGDNEVGDPRT